jgi:MSHA pilin protein MshC
MNIHLKKNHGFTMIEIIAVLLIMAIVTVVAVSKVASTSEYELKSQTAVIKSHLRYAQIRAIKSNGEWGICCDGSSYWLFRNGSTTDKVILPGENSDTITVSDRGLSSVEAFTLSFDDWGIPYKDASASTGQELASDDPEANITVSSGGNSENITITPNTGFVL